MEEKKSKADRCLHEENKARLIVRLLYEPFLMAGFGWAVAVRLNRLINRLIDSIYAMAGSTSNITTEQIAEYVAKYLPEKYADWIVLQSTEALDKMVRKFLLTSEKKFIIYFLMISVVTTIVYIFLLWLFEGAYYVEKGRFQTAVGIASYRSFCMMIPMLIGFVTTLVAIPITIVSFLAAIIVGIASLAKGMKTAFPKRRNRGLIVFGTFVMAEFVRISLYTAFFAYLLPKAL